MPGSGPPPQEQRRRRNVPERGEWVTAEGRGWQHGKVPAPPTGLTAQTRAAWRTWFGAWFAWYWTPDDLPGLRVVALLYDQVQRGELQRAPELRLEMEAFGMTPKGQQDRRWRRPDQDAGTPEKKARKYGNLKVVEG